MQSRLVVERKTDKNGKVTEKRKVVFGGSSINHIPKAELLPLSDNEVLEVKELQTKLKVGMPTRTELMKGEVDSNDRSAVKKLLKWEADHSIEIARYQHLRERDSTIPSIDSLRRD